MTRISRLLVTLLAVGCTTLPTGFDQLGPPPESRTITLLPDSLDSYSKYVPLGDAAELLLGRDDQYQSRVLIKFPVKDSALDSVTTVQLVLYPADSGLVPFVIRPCSTNWSTAAVTWRMADSVVQWLTPGGDYWHLDLAQDTLTKDSLIINLDRRYLDTLVRSAYGIILFPLDTGFIHLRSSTATGTPPRLRFTFLDNGKRTYTATEDAHIVDTFQLNSGLTDLLVGSGVAFRTYLYFNIESIPAAATVVSAELRFQPQVQYQRNDTLPVSVHRLSESYSAKGRNAGFSPGISASFRYVPADTDSIVRLDIRNLVQFWTANPDSNHGILLMAQPEWTDIFRIKLPRTGSAAPRLTVQYVLPPEDRFQR